MHKLRIGKTGFYFDHQLLHDSQQVAQWDIVRWIKLGSYPNRVGGACQVHSVCNII